MLSGAQRSRSISTGELTLDASNEAVEMLRSAQHDKLFSDASNEAIEMLRLRYAALSMTNAISFT